MGIEKFDSTRHVKLMVDMPFSYVSTPVYLDFCAYVLKLNDEDMVVTQDPVYNHDFPCLFLPKNEKNWEYMSASMVSNGDILKIKNFGVEIGVKNLTETEFYYSTKNLINPDKKYLSKINKFKKEYKYSVYDKYDKKEILNFFHFWQRQKSSPDYIYSKESNDFFFFCLDNLDKYNIQQTYVEINGKLVGLKFGVLHSKGKWASLHIKTDYQYRGLSQFLNHEIAKKFINTDIATLGTGCRSEGLIQYKKELGPVEERQYYYVLTRGKK